MNNDEFEKIIKNSLVYKRTELIIAVIDFKIALFHELRLFNEHVKKLKAERIKLINELEELLKR